MRSTTLHKRVTFQIRPAPPFQFDGTFHKPSHFPAPLNVWQPGRFWQTLRVGRRLYSVAVSMVYESMMWERTRGFASPYFTVEASARETWRR
ncbi:MAG: hypothetical protein ACLQDV_01870 [Candidatus Binataceae bacterium]